MATTAEHSTAYREYMASPAWSRRKRRWYRCHLRRRCRVCWKRKVHLHHRDYSRLGRERNRDLIPLCEKHHRDLHTYTRRNWPDVKSGTRAYLRMMRSARVARWWYRAPLGRASTLAVVVLALWR